MVYLTFIPQMEINVSRQQMLANIRLYHNLAEKVKIECGKPNVIYAANNEVCIGTAQVLNLVFGVHGIYATEDLDRYVHSGQLAQFFDNLIAKAKKQAFTHIVIVIPAIQYSAEVGLSICQISSAKMWHSNPDAYEERFITQNDVADDEVSVDVVDVFLNTIQAVSII